MQFGLTESQKILKDNARRFFSAECPITEVRRLMASDTAFDPVLWKKMAEQGFTGIIFPEEFGGLGLGKVELALLMEEMGYALVPGPFFSTVVLGDRYWTYVPARNKRKSIWRLSAMARLGPPWQH